MPLRVTRASTAPGEQDRRLLRHDKSMRSARLRHVLLPTAAALFGAILLAGCEPRPPKPKAVHAPQGVVSAGNLTPGGGAAAEPAQRALDHEGAWSPLGIQVREAPEAARRALGVQHGVMVVRIRPPASRTRLLPGDVIVGVNLASFRGIEEFNRLLEEAQRGAVALLVRRADADLYITLEASALPDGPDGSGDAARGAGPRRPATGKPLRT
jgi:hypothetical protein